MKLNASYKQIWGLTYPIMLGTLAQNIISLTDTIFLGRVGEVEQGACGLISIYYTVFVMMGLGLSRGGQILIARRTGQDNPTAIGFITYNLLYAEILLACCMFIFLQFISPTIIWLFIKSPEIYNASLQFLYFRSFGIFFSLFGFVLMSLYTGIGRTKVIAGVTVTLCLTNLILNYGLVLGNFGLPKMSIAGAGLASTIAEIVATIVGVLYVIFDKNIKKFNIHSFNPIDWQLIKHLLTISVPLVVQYLIGLGSWFVFFSLIEKMGERQLAVSIVLKIIYSFFSIPAWSFASAANSLVSNLMGQNKHRVVKTAIYRTSVLSLVVTLVMCLILMIFPETVLTIFTDQEAVRIDALPVLFVLVTVILGCSVATVIFNGIMGTGATKVSLLIEVVAVIIYLFYTYIVIKVLGLGLTHAWAAEFLYWVLLAVFSWFYLQSDKWKHLHV